MARRYTEQQFIEAINSSCSFRQALEKLGLAPAGGNYASLKKMIKKLGLNTEHMTHQGHAKAKNLGPKRPIEFYLSNKAEITSHHLRLRLISEKIFEHKCSICNLTKWMGKPIPIELDHINGNNKDNRLENIRILCNNCHAQTPNFRSKNRKI